MGHHHHHRVCQQNINQINKEIIHQYHNTQNLHKKRKDKGGPRTKLDRLQRGTVKNPSLP